jgi:D-alanyl-lipoteichoic acid acyltransferase DltB (MBOAT superfamily)
MSFISWDFAVFFLIVFGLYFFLSRKWQNILLLISSYVFYGWWSWRFLSLLLLSTCIDYYIALQIDRASGRKRLWLLYISLFVNLGVLAYFKYCNFFIESVSDMLQKAGFNANLTTLSIVLPVGISFYTFQSLAYTIDVYRKKIPVVKSLSLYALYVAYFPQLVAGPIERAQNIFPQLMNNRIITSEKIKSGMLLILIGFIRKVAIADMVSDEVKLAFNSPGDQTSLQLIRATFLFALQIYGDFAGYTDIARGVSRIFGIELMENFNHPYFATNITDFWRRWHISLSTWLRDYLYIPLGGNRGPDWFAYRNIIFTMLLGGLWHGASWKFVIWGGIHGLALVIHKIWAKTFKDKENNFISQLFIPFWWGSTMVVVCVAWVFFAANDTATAWQILNRIFSFSGGLSNLDIFLPLEMVGLLLLIDLPQYIKSDHTVMLKWPPLIKGFVYTMLILLLFLWGGKASAPFIYFQF